MKYLITFISLIVILGNLFFMYVNRPFGKWYVNDKYIYGVKNNHDLPFINDQSKKDKELMDSLDAQESFTSMNLTFSQWQELNRKGLLAGKV